MNGPGFLTAVKAAFSAIRKGRRVFWKIRKTVFLAIFLVFAVTIGFLLHKTKATYGDLAPESIVQEAGTLLKEGFNKELPKAIYASEDENEPDYFEQLLKGSTKDKEPEIKPSGEELIFTDSIPVDGSSLLIRFLDVGQGDATLITKGEHSVLIDTGEFDQLDRLRGYLADAEITTLDAVIGTHPHSDHIGSMATIIREYHPHTLYIPDVSSNTVSYDMMLKDASENGTNLVTICAGDTLEIGDIFLQILAPAKRAEYEDLNNYSVVTKIIYGSNSCLIAADAQDVSEKEMLWSFASEKNELSADILRVGHHGSETSTTKEFLAAVSPKAAVISVGEGNEFGHPHKKTMKALEEHDINVLRTDINGTITAILDGKNIVWHLEKGGNK